MKYWIIGIRCKKIPTVCYPFVSSVEEAGKLFKNKVQSIILENYPVALEMGVPEIVISADLAYELFSDYNV